jgi:pyrroloquinoline quinone biosynthesis protein D
MSADWRPALAASIMLRRDRVRDKDLLVMPERVVVLNPEAGRILRLCDGSRTTKQIADALAGDFPDAPIAADVEEFLDRIRGEGWLR